MNTITMAEVLFILAVFGGIGLCAIGLACGAWIMAKAEQIRQENSK